MPVAGPVAPPDQLPRLTVTVRPRAVMPDGRRSTRARDAHGVVDAAGPAPRGVSGRETVAAAARPGGSRDASCPKPSAATPAGDEPRPRRPVARMATAMAAPLPKTETSPGTLPRRSPSRRSLTADRVVEPIDAVPQARDATHLASAVPRSRSVVSGPGATLLDDAAAPAAVVQETSADLPVAVAGHCPRPDRGSASGARRAAQPLAARRTAGAPAAWSWLETKRAPALRRDHSALPLSGRLAPAAGEAVGGCDRQDMEPVVAAGGGEGADAGPAELVRFDHDRADRVFRTRAAASGSDGSDRSPPSPPRPVAAGLAATDAARTRRSRSISMRPDRAPWRRRCRWHPRRDGVFGRPRRGRCGRIGEATSASGTGGRERPLGLLSPHSRQQSSVLPTLRERGLRAPVPSLPVSRWPMRTDGAGRAPSSGRSWRALSPAAQAMRLLGLASLSGAARTKLRRRETRIALVEEQRRHAVAVHDAAGRRAAAVHRAGRRQRPRPRRPSNSGCNG